MPIPMPLEGAFEVALTRVGCSEGAKEGSMVGIDDFLPKKDSSDGPSVGSEEKRRLEGMPDEGLVEIVGAKLTIGSVECTKDGSRVGKSVGDADGGNEGAGDGISEGICEGNKDEATVGISVRSI